MLSRVAERVYWAARYLERAENTARLIDVYDKLMYDLPSSIDLSWYNLVTINSAKNAFEKRFTVKNERNVVKFLLSDQSNPISVISSIKMIRENLRTTRDVVPKETWEMVNELNIFLEENITLGVNRSKRFEFLDGLIKNFQQIHGLIYGVMPQDDAWSFMRIGRNIERADMTSRVLDAGVSAVLSTDKNDSAFNQQQTVWGSVLRSLGADQPYRRCTGMAVVGEDVVRYLLKDALFPRTIMHCYMAIENSSERLPRSNSVSKHIKERKKRLLDVSDEQTLDNDLRNYLNDLQLDLASIHQLVHYNWFANHA